MKKGWAPANQNWGSLASPRAVQGSPRLCSVTAQQPGCCWGSARGLARCHREPRRGLVSGENWRRCVQKRPGSDPSKRECVGQGEACTRAAGWAGQGCPQEALPPGPEAQSPVDECEPGEGLRGELGKGRGQTAGGRSVVIHQDPGLGGRAGESQGREQGAWEAGGRVSLGAR